MLGGEWIFRQLFFSGQPIRGTGLLALFPLTPLAWVAGLIAKALSFAGAAGTIHKYYVLREELSEADKSWRRKR